MKTTYSECANCLPKIEKEKEICNRKTADVKLKGSAQVNCARCGAFKKWQK